MGTVDGNITDFIDNFGKASSSYTPSTAGVFAGLDFWGFLLLAGGVILALVVLSKVIRWFSTEPR